MITKCPHCKKEFDVPVKTVLGWITASKKLLQAVRSLVSSLNRAQATPDSQRRDVDYAELARKSHEARRANRNRE
jgi:transposase-like protein